LLAQILKATSKLCTTLQETEHKCNSNKNFSSKRHSNT
jgi:hypothetical protein